MRAWEVSHPAPVDEGPLRLAPRLGVRATTVPYPLERAAAALADLAHDRITGAGVLHVG